MAFKVTDLLIDSIEAKSKPRPTCKGITCDDTSCGPCTQGVTCRCTICNTLTGSPSQCANPQSTNYTSCMLSQMYERDLERLLGELRRQVEHRKEAA